MVELVELNFSWYRNKLYCFWYEEILMKFWFKNWFWLVL